MDQGLSPIAWMTATTDGGSELDFWQALEDNGFTHRVNGVGARTMDSFSRWRCTLVVMLLLGISIAACTTQPLGRSDLLSFIRDGQTNREQTILSLGEPAALYEGGRILAFRLGKDDGGHFLVGKGAGFSSVKISLIMVFDDHGVLLRHSLVQVKAP